MAKKFVGLDGLKHFWSKAKTWITAQITSEVTARIAELVANAPEDLDTLKEIADWINTHADSASAMNTAIQNNAKAISDEATARANADSALQTAIDGKASSSHTHDDRYYTESEVDTKLSGKADVGHTHTKSQITDFPSGLPPKFENNTWYLVGDDIKIGDHNIAGGLGLLGNNGNTRLDFCQYGNESNFKSIIFDGSTLYMDGKASTAGSADKAIQDGNGNVITSTYAIKSEVLQFDHIVDSDAALAEWANCIDGSMKKVLVKAGTYTLSGGYIELSSAGTNYIFAEPGNKLNFTNTIYGISRNDIGNKIRIIGLNVSVSGGNASTAFYNCDNLLNCTAEASSSGISYGFKGCNNISNSYATVTSTISSYNKNLLVASYYQCNKISNSEGYATNYNSAYGFLECNYLNNCTGEATAGQTRDNIYGCGFRKCKMVAECIGYGKTSDANTRGYGRCFYYCNMMVNCCPSRRGYDRFSDNLGSYTVNVNTTPIDEIIVS